MGASSRHRDNLLESSTSASVAILAQAKIAQAIYRSKHQDTRVVRLCVCRLVCLLMMFSQHSLRMSDAWRVWPRWTKKVGPSPVSLVCTQHTRELTRVSCASVFCVQVFLFRGSSLSDVWGALVNGRPRRVRDTHHEHRLRHSLAGSAVIAEGSGEKPYERQAGRPSGRVILLHWARRQRLRWCKMDFCGRAAISGNLGTDVVTRRLGSASDAGSSWFVLGSELTADAQERATLRCLLRCCARCQVVHLVLRVLVSCFWLCMLRRSPSHFLALQRKKPL